MQDILLTNKKRFLGICTDQERTYIYSTESASQHKQLVLEVSENHLPFRRTSNRPIIIAQDKTQIDPSMIITFRISHLGTQFFLVFSIETSNHLFVAYSKDLITWHSTETDIETSTGIIVPQLKGSKEHAILFTTEEGITLATSKDYHTWMQDDKPILPISMESISQKETGLLGTILYKDELAVVYYEQLTHANETAYTLHICILSKTNPRKVLWELERPFWHSPEEWRRKTVVPLSILFDGDEVNSYWDLGNGMVSAVKHAIIRSLLPKSATSGFKLAKHRKNPIIEPRNNNIWESQAVFNPAAVYDNGKVHLLYRAVGDKYISVLGYASSDDGIHFTDRPDEPAYVPREQFEGAYTPGANVDSLYKSGPGWGGCEDPRMTIIDDQGYLLYVAFDGWSPPRLAMSSIDMRDFRQKKWVWDRPVLISRPGVVNKNACLLPEKVRGKYVMFHRVFPHILIDYLDDLDFDGETKWLQGQAKISPTVDGWDSRKVAAGPPPIKTDKGWLLIYHAVDDKNDSQYKIGAMLLDYEYPEQIIARTKQPILAPNMWYENDGYKAGVAYPCGAVVIDGILYVYYGGADSVICVATANLNQFLDALLHDERITMENASSTRAQL